ncbi:MAG: flagellar FliJ family protein [Ruminococcus sp.]|jgi:flagellar export protein FliJ|nr:flagellar FliJ family protein [Ruminococcus sp.]
MKRFEFTLNKLMGFKRQLLDREKNSLAVIRSERLQFDTEKSAVIEDLKRSNEEFNGQSQVGLNIMQINAFKNYHYALHIKIKSIDTAIEDCEKRIARQLQRVLDATKEVKSLEKLEEKQLEDYNFKLQKADENFIAEYVNNLTLRRRFSDDDLLT